MVKKEDIVHSATNADPNKIAGADLTASLQSNINNIDNRLNTFLYDLAKLKSDVPYISLNNTDNFSNGLKIVGVSKDVEGTPITSGYGICYVLKSIETIYQLCIGQNNKLYWRAWWVANAAPQWNQIENYLPKQNYGSVTSIAELDNFVDTEGTIFLGVGGHYAFVKIEIFKAGNDKVVLQTRYNMRTPIILTRKGYYNLDNEFTWTAWA